MLGESIGAAIGILPSPQVASTVNGPAIPRPGVCTIVAFTGATTGSPSSFTVDMKVQDSANGTTGWADIVLADVPTITAINTLANLDLDLSASATKPFLRVVSTVAFVAGTAPTVQVAAIVVTGGNTTFPIP